MYALHEQLESREMKVWREMLRLLIAYYGYTKERTAISPGR